MEEHPDIEKLLEHPDSKEVSAHIEVCEICRMTVADLQTFELNTGDLIVPFSVSEIKEGQIKEEIKSRAVEIRRILFRRNVFTKVSAVAAVLIIGSFWLFKNTHESDKINVAEKVVAEDFNGDGKANVIDSFLLAKALKAGEKPAKGDFDGNGITDNNDLAELRRRIVKTGGGR